MEYKNNGDSTEHFQKSQPLGKIKGVSVINAIYFLLIFNDYLKTGATVNYQVLKVKRELDKDERFARRVGRLDKRLARGCD